MRIACIHLPAFPLQVFLRAYAPGTRRGDAIAVVERGAPTIVACSRAARAAGVAVGMAAATAREIAPSIEIATVDAGQRDAAARAIAEAVCALSPRVDLGSSAGAHHAIFAEVPAGMRGATFGARALALLEAIGAIGRVGIADDRFTARVAATGGAADVTTVPRGGSAAFLAPLPLSLLAISGEVRHMLETLGVHTLGAFASLPPPSVARPEDADWQALARGDGGAALARFAPAGPIVERIAMPSFGGGAADTIDELAARVAARLAGRGRAAAAIEVVIGGGRAIEIVPDAPIDGRDELAQAIAARVGGALWVVPEWSLATPSTPTPPAETSIEVRVRAFAHDAGADGVEAIPAAVTAEASAPLTLAPVVSVVGAAPRAPHRRTRRGKDRPRLARPSAQRPLFAGLELRAR
jgi:protein ImuB